MLRSMRLREADRIVHLYTGAHGRVGAVVKGVRRTRRASAAAWSRSSACGSCSTGPRRPRHGHAGGGDRVVPAAARAARASCSAAGAACESVLRLFGEGRPTRPPTTCSATSCSCSTPSPAAAGPANLLAFRLKLLLAAGFVPELAACARCGEAPRCDGAGIAFSPAAGRRVCAELRRRRAASRSTARRLAFMFAALGAPLREAPEAPTRPTLGAGRPSRDRNARIPCPRATAQRRLERRRRASIAA